MKHLLSICIFAMFAPLSLWANVWEPLGLQDESVGGLVIDQRNPDIMYAVVWRDVKVVVDDAILERDVLKTMDGGKTWESIRGQNIESITCVAIDPIDSNNIYVGSYDVLFSSRDGGETWDKQIQPGIVDEIVIPHDEIYLEITTQAKHGWWH